MRVLQITASAGYGGGPQHLYDLITNFDSNILIDVACPRQEPFWERYGAVISGAMIQIPERKFTLRDAARLVWHIKANKVQLIHSHGKGAGVYGRFLSIVTRTPLVHTPHGIHIGQYGWLMKCFYVSYEWLTGWIDACTVFVSPSELFRAKSLRFGMRGKRFVIANGVRSCESEASVLGWRNRLRDSLGLTSRDVVVATLSRFDFAKNMREMAEIAKSLPRVHFWLLGNGKDYEEVVAFCQANELTNVWMPGMVSEPIQYLAASDIYLSTSRWEGLPLAVLQAMSLGKPVVASDVTGNKDAVVNDVTGFLYKLGDISNAVMCIQALVDETQTMKQMGEAAKDRQRKEFSVYMMAQKTAQIYSRILG